VTSKTLVSYYNTASPHSPEDLEWNVHYRDDLESRSVIMEQRKSYEPVSNIRMGYIRCVQNFAKNNSREETTCKN